MKPICRNCHFLSKEIRESGSGRVLVFTLIAKERERGVPGPEIIAPHFSLNCHMGVWDEGVSAPADRNAVLDIARGSSTCFFFPHNPAMLFAAAKELQKRSAENEQLKRSNFYTRVGLWVAAAALALNALVELLKHV